MLKHECTFAVLLQSMQHRKNTAKSCVRNTQSQQCHAKEQYMKQVYMNDRFSVGHKENTKIMFKLNKTQMALAHGQKEFPEIVVLVASSKKGFQNPQLTKNLKNMPTQNQSCITGGFKNLQQIPYFLAHDAL
jgi:hypothetical protein